MKKKDALNKETLKFEAKTNKMLVGGAFSLGQSLVSTAVKNSKAQFAISKGLAVAQATISAFQASNMALANPPGPPYSIPQSTAALTQGLITAGMIGAQGLIQSFAAREGGTVPGIGNGDKIPMWLEPGEVITPKKLVPTFEQTFKKQEQTEQSGGVVKHIITLDDDAVELGFRISQINRRNEVMGIA